MSVQSSFSDWESVQEDKGIAHNDGFDDDNESITIVSKPQPTAKVIIELPRGGLQVPSGADTQQTTVSSIGSSFVRDVGGLALEKKIDTKQSTDSSTANSSSSFVVVSVQGNVCPTNDDDQKPCAVSRRRGYSSVSTSSDSSICTSSDWSYSYTSVVATPVAAHCTKEASSSSSIVGSIINNFVNISLSSGASVMRCKRCKFHNAAASKICAACELALVTNPCTPLDREIAFNLQRKEENEAGILLLEREMQRQRLVDEPPFKQASFLAEEIQPYLLSFRQKQEWAGGLRVLPWLDFRWQILNFILNIGGCAKISVAYKFTPSSHETVESIQKRGFLKIEEDNFSSRTVNCDLNEAWDSFMDGNPAMYGQNMDLFPICERNDDIKALSSRGWIVAVARRASDSTCDGQSTIACKDIIPLVGFDAALRHNKDLQHMTNGLSTICCDFFECLRLISPEADLAPHPAKKPRFGQGHDQKSNEVAAKHQGHEKDNQQETFHETKNLPAVSNVLVQSQFEDNQASMASGMAAATEKTWKNEGLRTGRPGGGDFRWDPSIKDNWCPDYTHGSRSHVANGDHGHHGPAAPNQACGGAQPLGTQLSAVVGLVTDRWTLEQCPRTTDLSLNINSDNAGGHSVPTNPFFPRFAGRPVDSSRLRGMSMELLASILENLGHSEGEIWLCGRQTRIDWIMKGCKYYEISEEMLHSWAKWA